MHIHDGFLDPLTCIIFYAISIPVVIYAGRRYFREGGDVYYLSIMAAAIFAAQMLNWPIPGGTSAHLVGGALSAMILGPFGGCLAMFMNLIVQCLLMGDGGITALGANVFNMAIVDVFAGYLIYKLSLRVLGEKRRFIAAFLGGWIGIALAAVACGFEIGLSPQFGYPVLVTVPVMGVWHLALGVIEGLATAFVISYLTGRRWVVK
ncbi:MAG TPA: metal transporter [Candidatus Korarchaeota archaeon]|nr:metal transporter [Candidatus Korarchaeota archaeon]